jgi:7,8-dihydropterin-6-yl-methyl-4-(beta-D-ribofuranosyl)aminobenzene 5'-phosphate synthase
MAASSRHPVTITIVYDNNAYLHGLRTDWGFAAVVAYGGHTILFDTGGQGAILLRNMATLGIDPQTIEHVVLSHTHHDHSGGLYDLLATGVHPVVYLPPCFPQSFKQQVAAQTTIVETAPGMQVVEGVYVTGELAGDVPEQALVLVTGRGLVIVTGCAHPGVDRIVRRARELFDQQVYLVLGGFHLRSAKGGEIARLLRALREIGVQRVAPGHCTGEAATVAFSNEYEEHYLHAGVGRVIEIPAAKAPAVELDIPVGRSLQTFYEDAACPNLLKQTLDCSLFWQQRVDMTVERVLLSPHLASGWVAGLLAVGARVVYDNQPEEEAPLADYLRGRGGPGRRLKSVRIAVDKHGQWGEAHVARMPGDRPIVSAAASVEMHGGIVRGAHLALTGVWRESARLAGAVGLLTGQPLDAGHIESVVQAVEREVEPTGDFLGSANYRRAMAATLTRRVLQQCQLATGRE